MILRQKKLWQLSLVTKFWWQQKVNIYISRQWIVAKEVLGQKLIIFKYNFVLTKIGLW